MRADHLFIVAGLIAFLGNFKQQGGFPSNGAATVAATAVLAFLAAMTQNGKAGPAIRAFAALAVLAAVFYYVPGLTKKGKANG